MKCAILLTIALPLCPLITMAEPQPAQSTHAAPVSKRPQWTETQKKTLLAKAQDGDASSQFWVGTGYERGWFGEADYREALKWLRRSAERGNPDAQNCLGQMYEEGEGVPQNYALAAKWYRRAAEHVPDFGGAGQGRNNLGLLYLSGHGVQKDAVRAYMWFRLANAEVNLSAAKEEMTSAQVREAEGMAKEWKNAHPER